MESTVENNIKLTFGEFDDEKDLECIQEYLDEGEGQCLLNWESRATHEWMLSNYGLAPATNDVTDDMVALCLIQASILHHLEISPHTYNLQVKIDR